MRNMFVALCALTCIGVAAAQPPVVMDGGVDRIYYNYDTPIMSQDTETQFGDNSLGRPDVANGSELDGVYGFIYVYGAEPLLCLVLTGNFETNGNKLELFFDTRPGGQNRLLSTNPGTPNTGLLRMSEDPNDPETYPGLTFKAGFEADFWVSVACYGDPTNIYVDYAELYVDEFNPGALYYVGEGKTKCETLGGALTGGQMGAPVMWCTADNSNVAGVIGGTNPDLSGQSALVKTGVEIAIPLSAIGYPSGDIHITAFINGQQHDWVSNQLLGGMFGGGNLAEPRQVDLNNVVAHMPFSVSTVYFLPLGACCFEGQCTVTTQSACAGTWYANVPCDDVSCDGTPMGRCCIDDGFAGLCEVTTEAECTSLFGVWTEGQTCDGCPCLLPRTGACCDGEVCTQESEDACVGGGKVYVGDFTSCNDLWCALGACCENQECTVVPRHACVGFGQEYLGAGTDCTNDPCSGPTIDTPHIAGEVQSPPWVPDANPMVETAPGSWVWTLEFTGLMPNAYYEYKVTDGTWNQTIPAGPNSWCYADGNGAITFTYDGNFYNDGWAPNRDRLGQSSDPGTWTATGNFLVWVGGSNWNNADPAGQMLPTGDPGIYKWTRSGELPPGTYEWKAVVTGTWRSISWDGRSVNTSNMQFTVQNATDVVSLYVDQYVGRVKVEITPGVTICLGDLDCDGDVDFDDIDSFVNALGGIHTECSAVNGDIDQDGDVDFDDIDPFVTALGGTPNCYEP